MRMGGQITNQLADLLVTAANTRTVSLETAPTLLAMLTTSGADMRTAFTKTSGNCPTFNQSTGTFTAAECNTGATVAGSNTGTVMGNNIPTGQEAGVLTNPGFMAQFYSYCGMGSWSEGYSTLGQQRDPAEIPWGKVGRSGGQGQRLIAVLASRRATRTGWRFPAWPHPA